jgi:tetratricopeptide (TPR) repeat protein
MLHGPLHEIGLVEVLQLLERGARTGRLRVVGPDPSVPRVIAIRQGRIVGVSPDADNAAVAQGLVRRFLAVGTDDAIDGPEAVTDAVRGALRESLARRTIATMLAWTRGRFDFSEDLTVTGELEWSPDALLLDVVRREGARLDLAEALGGFDRVPVFARRPDTDVPPPPIRLDATDWRLLDVIDGVRDIAAVAAILDEPLEEVAERLRELRAAAILDLRDPPLDVATQARAAIEAGRHADAIPPLQARLAAAPGDGEAWRLLGLAEVGAGRFARAIEAWEAWAAADPRRALEATALVRAAHTMLEALQESRD